MGYSNECLGSDLGWGKKICLIINSTDKMYCRRLKKVCIYGWRDAKEISQNPEVRKSHIAIFCDILYCYLNYGVWSNQYKKGNVYSLKAKDKQRFCIKYQEKNDKRDRWIKGFFDNYRFLNKWSGLKYEQSSRLQLKRHAAYRQQYGLGENCVVGYNVILHRHHFSDSVIVTGKNCLLAEGVNIDYTGGLTMGNTVSISEGAKILTHNHSLDYSSIGDDKGCELTPLVIQDSVWIGAKAVILPGVKEIGRGAMISSSCCVRSKVLPYAIMMGNPAKLVGFRFLPKVIVEIEKSRYSESERIPLDLLESNYQKYYKDRIKEIKEFVKQ